MIGMIPTTNTCVVPVVLPPRNLRVLVRGHGILGAAGVYWYGRILLSLVERAKRGQIHDFVRMNGVILRITDCH